MNAPRIASLFTGTGALDLAVQDVYGGELIWHSQYEPPGKDGREDKHQWAAQILHRHWPDVPNLGDITKVQWSEVEPVDILTGGFPCQDVSSAGKRAGLAPDSRSGLWTHMARAISVLRPRLVVIENVQGLLSAKADRGLGSDDETVDEGTPGGVLRALGAVLGDLATLGFDAEWCRVAASEVGAPHPRKRIFIVAWPATADAPHVGHERCGGTRDGRTGPAHSDLTPADADGRRCEGDQERDSDLTPADADGRRCEGDQERDSRAPFGEPERQRGLDSVGRGVQRTAAPDARGTGLEERRVEPGGPQLPAAERSDCEPGVDWGGYGPAVRRWEHVLGRRAPRPVDDLGRLNPPFVEWMMGLPAGWVVDTPGITRPAALKALGNGVVRQQAAAALRLLWERMPVEARLPLAGCPEIREAA